MLMPTFSLNSIFTLHLPPTLKGLVAFVAFHAKTNSLFQEKYLCKPTLQLITFLKGFVNGEIQKKAGKRVSHAEPIGILKWERQEITHYDIVKDGCPRWSHGDSQQMPLQNTIVLPRETLHLHKVLREALFC